MRHAYLAMLAQHGRSRMLSSSSMYCSRLAPWPHRPISCRTSRVSGKRKEHSHCEPILIARSPSHERLWKMQMRTSATRAAVCPLGSGHTSVGAPCYAAIQTSQRGKSPSAARRACSLTQAQHCMHDIRLDSSSCSSPCCLRCPPDPRAHVQEAKRCSQDYLSPGFLLPLAPSPSMETKESELRPPLQGIRWSTALEADTGISSRKHPGRVAGTRFSAGRRHWQSRSATDFARGQRMRATHVCDLFARTHHHLSCICHAHAWIIGVAFLSTCLRLCREAGAGALKSLAPPPFLSSTW